MDGPGGDDYHAGAGGAGGGEVDRHATLLSTIDYSAIDDMDPSVADGFRVIYDRECPFEMRIQQDTADGPQEVGTHDAVKVKILLKGSDEDPDAVRIELSSESDLFFHFVHTSDEAAFRAVQAEQKLMIDFPEYPNVLIRMLNSCIKELHTHLAVFVMHHDGHARLDFIQNMEYKFLELLSVNFVRSNDDVVRQQITYRYNAVKSRLAIMQARLQDVNNLVKIKNPSLLLQLQKDAAGGGGPRGGGGTRGSTSARSVGGASSGRF